MSDLIGKWKLLRTKTDETTDDTDWVGTNTEPDDSICAAMPRCDSYHNPLTGIEVRVLGVTSALAPVDRETPDDTVDLQLVDVASRENRSLGGTPGLAPLLGDTTKITGVVLQETVYFPLNGSQKFTIRITNDSSLAATVDRLEIWWREVSR